MSAASYGRDRSDDFLPDSGPMWTFCAVLAVFDASMFYVVLSRAGFIGWLFGGMQ